MNTISTRIAYLAGTVLCMAGLTGGAHSQDFIGQSDCPRCETNGTLFRWSACPSVTGGPDLDEPLVTDRPDFTEASSTVGVGVAQIEFGYTFLDDDDGTSSLEAHSWGEPLLRYGVLADWLEFRLAVFPVTEEIRQAGTTTTNSGTEDLYLGLKLGLTPQAGWRPEMALIPQMTVPTGSAAFTADEVLPGVNWLYSWELCDWLSTGGSTQFNRAVDDVSESYTEWAQSWTLAAAINDCWGAYAEWFAFFPHSSRVAQSEHFFNGGFTRLLSNDVQWDIRAGVGLNDAAADFFAGTGLTIRFH